MTNLNPIQVITQIATNVLSVQASNAGHASGAQNAENSGLIQNFQAAMQGGESAGNAQIIFTRAPIILSADSQLKLTTIEIDKKANYAKDLLNLPREFSDLINLITSQGSSVQTVNEQMMAQLNKLLQGGKVDLALLGTLLNENSKEAMQKLMMTIANLSKYGTNDVSGLKQLMNLFAVNTAAVQDSQALKNLLILYLPWLPLSVRHNDNLDFTIDIFDKIQGPDPDKMNPTESVTVFIETKNYGNITANLETTPIGQIDVNIQAPKEFPHKKAMELIDEASSINNVKTNLTSEPVKIAAENISTKENVKIVSQSAISPKLMLVTQSLIKIIIELDYQKTIIKEEEDNKDS